MKSLHTDASLLAEMQQLRQDAVFQVEEHVIDAASSGTTPPCSASGT